MKKFLSMALAVIMACNFTLLGSGNIAAADYEDEEYYNFSINPYEDDYNYDFNEDLSKEEKGNKPSKIWTVFKVFSLAACVAFLGYIVIYLTTNPALSNNPEVKKIIEKINDLLSKMKGKVSGYNIKNPKVKEVIEKINNLLSETKDTVSGYYNNIADQMNKSYENVCPADSTNGAWDCLLKSLGLRKVVNCAPGYVYDPVNDKCVDEEMCYFNEE